MAPLQSSKQSNRCISIEGPTILDWNGSFTIFQTFKLHSYEDKASEIPPFDKWLPHFPTSLLISTHRRSHHYASGFPTSSFLIWNQQTGDPTTKKMASPLSNVRPVNYLI